MSLLCPGTQPEPRRGSLQPGRARKRPAWQGDDPPSSARAEDGPVGLTVGMRTGCTGRHVPALCSKLNVHVPIRHLGQPCGVRPMGVTVSWMRMVVSPCVELRVAEGHTWWGQGSAGQSVGALSHHRATQSPWTCLPSLVVPGAMTIFPLKRPFLEPVPPPDALSVGPPLGRPL